MQVVVPPSANVGDASEQSMVSVGRLVVML